MFFFTVYINLVTEFGPEVCECSQRPTTLFIIYVMLLFHVAFSVRVLILKCCERYPIVHAASFHHIILYLIALIIFRDKHNRTWKIRDVFGNQRPVG
jgi:uncharacterized protein YebE (UPF0316 family)